MNPSPLTKFLDMKVKIKKTGEILDVNTYRANYWIRCNVAIELGDHPDIIKVKKEEPEKRAYKKTKADKKA